MWGSQDLLKQSVVPMEDVRQLGHFMIFKNAYSLGPRNFAFRMFSASGFVGAKEGSGAI